MLHPPPKGKSWVEFATWDDRIEKFRLPALHYRGFLEAMRAEGVAVTDKAKGFTELTLNVGFDADPLSTSNKRRSLPGNRPDGAASSSCRLVPVKPMSRSWRWRQRRAARSFWSRRST